MNAQQFFCSIAWLIVAMLVLIVLCVIFWKRLPWIQPHLSFFFKEQLQKHLGQGKGMVRLILPDHPSVPSDPHQARCLIERCGYRLAKKEEVAELGSETNLSFPCIVGARSDGSMEVFSLVAPDTRSPVLPNLTTAHCSFAVVKKGHKE